MALAITALFLCVAPLTGNIAGARDFVVYWATGQQLVHHGNPYDVDAMMRIEIAAGLPGKYGVLFMRNPPGRCPLLCHWDWSGQGWERCCGRCCCLHACGFQSAWFGRCTGIRASCSTFLAIVCAGIGVPDRGQTSLFALVGLVCSCASTARGHFCGGCRCGFAL